MIPVLRDGDVVTIVPEKRCRLGDIVLFRRGDALLLHRVVAKFSGRVVTKGDALGGLDFRVAPQDILGRAVWRERRCQKRSLDSLEARLVGLAFCLTLSWIPVLFKILHAMLRLTRKKLGLDGA
jgi:hypothetical protein